MNKLLWIGFQHERQICERAANALRDVHAMIGSSEAEYVRVRYIQLLEKYEQKEIDEPREEEASKFRLPLCAVIKLLRSAPFDTYFGISQEAIEYFKAERIEAIRHAIGKGLTLPNSILCEYPRNEFAAEFKSLPPKLKAHHTAITYQTGEITEGLLKSHGVLIGRQDGIRPTREQLSEISAGLDELYLAVGDLSELCRTTNLLIAHTNGRQVFRSPYTVGQFRAIYNAITLGVNGNGERSGLDSLAHELAGHWLDVASVPPQYWINQVMGKDQAIPREILSMSFLDAWIGRERVVFSKMLDLMNPLPNRFVKEAPQIFTPDEIWGRGVEQYAADRLSRKGVRNPICVKSLAWYFNQPGYWPEDNWKKSIREIVQHQFRARIWMARRVNGLSESRIRRPPRCYRSIFPWVDEYGLEFFGPYWVERHLPRDVLEE